MDKSSDIALNKIWGCWTGKISGGTYGQLVEGKFKKRIQSMNPPLTGWMSGAKNSNPHKQIINDDEQYELIALLALESLSDDQIQQEKTNHSLLNPDFLGSFWTENLDPKYVFTAEKAALDNATKHHVPWMHAGDEIYNGTYQNQYYDWIGAQMKGELFGMLAPAWNWHEDLSPTPESDFQKLALCLELSLQDGLIAHRGIAIVGELFVSAMVAIGIDYDPYQHHIIMNYPSSTAKDRPNAEEQPRSKEEILQSGITAEIIISDIQRLKAVLQNYDKMQLSDVDKYFEFIDPIIREFTTNWDNRGWEVVWAEIEKITKPYRKELLKDAKIRLKNTKLGLKEREITIKFSKAFKVHTVANNSAIVIGLLYGDGDMFQTTQRATECGLDTDCNAGNAAAILGAYLGQELISPYMKRFIRGEILSPLKNWKGISIQQLAERCLKQSERLTES